MDGTGKPDYAKCVEISTNASIKKMMLPGAIALISPVIVGFVFGPQVLGGFLAGATVTGVLMGIFQNNAGGAWDNAKKSFEQGAVINGETYFKGSEPHKASVTGDTVGDPFKDTSGPSMNILIKLMCIISLVIAPTLADIHKDKIIEERKQKLENLIRMDEGTSSKQLNIDKWTLETAGLDANVQAEIKEFMTNLKQDHLLTGESFSLAVQDNQLFIDGDKQSDEIVKKYKEQIETTGNFITKEPK